MSAYQFFELALVGSAVAYSAWRVWQRYFRRVPTASASASAVEPGCGSCGAKTGCSKPE